MALSLKEQRRLRRLKRYPGRLTIDLSKKVKSCWISKQDKNGWSLGYAYRNRTIWLRNVRFKTRADVEKAMEKCSLVFIELKNKGA